MPVKPTQDELIGLWNRLRETEKNKFQSFLVIGPYVATLTLQMPVKQQPVTQLTLVKP